MTQYAISLLSNEHNDRIINSDFGHQRRARYSSKLDMILFASETEEIRAFMKTLNIDETQYKIIKFLSVFQVGLIADDWRVQRRCEIV